MAKQKGSKKVVCRGCGKNYYLFPGTARTCSDCWIALKLPPTKKGR